MPWGLGPGPQQDKNWILLFSWIFVVPAHQSPQVPINRDIRSISPLSFIFPIIEKCVKKWNLVCAKKSSSGYNYWGGAVVILPNGSQPAYLRIKYRHNELKIWVTWFLHILLRKSFKIFSLLRILNFVRRCLLQPRIEVKYLTLDILVGVHLTSGDGICK